MTDNLDDNLEDWADLRSQEDWSGLLVGNGLSQNLWRRFGYTSLFETASHGDGAQLSAADISLFDRMETRNFEVVLSALAISKSVSAALEQPLEPFSEREESIRQALIRAVHAVHVPWTSVPDAHLDRIAAELSAYSSVYCTNYDLTLYWSLMRDPRAFRDYFWSEKFDITNTEVWGKKTKVHFLHGGLHLYRRPNGQTLKRSAASGQNLLDLFGTPYHDAMPLFISEGTAQEKLASIYRSDYLSFVFARLAQDAGPLVIFGHSLGNSDRHLVDAIASHNSRPIAVALQAIGNIRQEKASVIRSLPDSKIYFYDAATHPLGAADLKIEEPVQ
jgi:hypothetical protein